jgi:hypothetical protein
LPEVEVRIGSKQITLYQSGMSVTLTWEAFEKMSSACRAISNARAELWRVNHPEEKS